MYVPASVRRSFLAGFRPWIRHPFAGRDFRIPKQNRDFQSKTAIFVARMGLWHGFDDITRFTKHKISIPAPIWQAPQIKQENSALPHQPTNGCIVTVPLDHHVISGSRMCRGCTSGSSLSFFSLFPRPRVDRCAQGGSLSTRASRPALPLSLQRSFFPHGFPPSSSPLLRRGHTTVLP